MLLLEQWIVAAQHHPRVSVPIYLVAINLLTYAAYWYDKKASIQRRWRIPEQTLHVLMFLGGTLGAYLGQRVVRHKNRKESFQWVFRILVLVQVVCVIWLTRG